MILSSQKSPAKLPKKSLFLGRVFGAVCPVGVAGRHALGLELTFGSLVCIFLRGEQRR